MQTLIAIIAAASTIIIVVIALFTLYQKTSDNYWVVESLKKKINCAKSLKGKKIFVVGGSNVHFGVSAEIIQSIVGVPAINFGVHAGISFLFLYLLCRPLLRPGDIVVMALEYQYYGPVLKTVKGAIPISKLTTSVCLSLAPHLFFKLSRKEQMEFIRKFELRQFSERVKAKFKGIIPEAPYSTLGINAYGDETINYAKVFDVSAHLEGYILKEKDNNICLFDCGEERRWYIERFVRWCRANHIEIFATWPVTIKEKPYCSPFVDDVRSKISDFYEELGVKILCDPKENELPRELMLDMHYHPNINGARIRSERLGEAICQVMGIQLHERCDAQDREHASYGDDA